jgi:hypothetical protein
MLATAYIYFFVSNQKHFLLVSLDRQMSYYLTTKSLCNMSVWRKKPLPERLTAFKTKNWIKN